MTVVVNSKPIDVLSCSIEGCRRDVVFVVACDSTAEAVVDCFCVECFRDWVVGCAANFPDLELEKR